MAADGSIIIDTKIDTQGFSTVQEKANITISRLQSSLRRLEAEYDSVKIKRQAALAEGNDVKAERLDKQYDRIYDNIEVKRKELEYEIKRAAQRQAEAEADAAEKTAKANQKSTAAMRKTVKPTAQVAKSTEKSSKSMGAFAGRVKSIVASAFIFNVLSEGLRKLTDSLWGAISSTSEMKTALSNLKGAAFTAASPLIDVLSKALATLANAAAKAFSYVTQLYSLLSGKSLSAIANTAEQMGNVADASGAAAKNADKAKKSLAGFDEITTLDTNKNASGGGGGGAAGANYDYNLNSGMPAYVEAIAAKIQELIEPLKNIDFKPAQDALQRLGDSFGSLAASIGGALEWAWANILLPLSGWTIEEAAPASIDLLAAAFDLVSAALDPIIDGLDGFMEYLEPVFDYIGDNVLIMLGDWEERFRLVADTLEEKGPEIEGVIENVGEAFRLVWDKIEPIMLWLQETAKKTMTFMNEEFSIGIGLVIDTFYGLTEFLNGIFTGDWGRAWDGIKSIFSGVGEAIGESAKALEEATGIPFTNIYNWAKEKFTNVKNTVLDAWSAIKNSNAWQTISTNLESAWNGIKTSASTQFTNVKNSVLNAWTAIKNSSIWGTIKTSLTNTFTSIKDKASSVFNSMKTSIVNVFNALKTAIKTPINGIIGVINKMISGIVSGINSAIRTLNSVKFSVPSWIPGIGGNSFGFKIPTITATKIPYLAKGAVIPPNAPFMAMLGDQKHGTNVEAPLSTIQEAVAIVMEDMVGGMVAGFEATVAVLREILEAICGIEIGDDVIANAVNSYNRKMAVVKGG